MGPDAIPPPMSPPRKRGPIPRSLNGLGGRRGFRALPDGPQNLLMLRLLAVLVLVLTAGPALAEPTARVVGGNIPVYSGPGRSYPVIARIPDGTTVPLEYCTRPDSEW